jgi:hypothetical protein
MSGTLQNAPFLLTCGITSGSANVTVTTGGEETDTSCLYAGLPVSGTGIPGATTVQSITNATTFVLSGNASATSAAAKITATPASAAVVGRVTNPNINKGFDLVLTQTDNLGRVDTKRWDGYNLTGTVDLELLSSTAIFPRQGALLTLDGLSDPQLNRVYSISQVGAAYPKGAFVVYSLTVESTQMVEGQL